ncbi:MAG TPA: PAS domain-containing protein, partial [Acetobacteraceae bacterium]|nr:PAS domain-containing protein [Acetobacteraceae bacterium]
MPGLADVTTMYEDEVAPEARAAAFDAAPEPIKLLSRTGIVLRANLAAQQSLLRPNADLTGRSVFELVAPEHHETLRSALEAASIGRCCRVEVQARAADATPIWWETSFYPLDAAQPGYVVMSCRDITAARLRDLGLTGQARILRAIAQGAPLNDTLEQCCALAEQLLEGSRCCVLLHETAGTVPDNGDAERSELIAGLHTLPYLEGGGASFRMVATADFDTAADAQAWQLPPKKQGLTTCWSLPLRANGQTVGAFAVYFRPPRPPTDAELERAWDCTSLAAMALAQREAGRALSDSEARFSVAAGVVPGFLFVSDAAGHLTYVNATYRERTGRTEKDLINGGWLETIHPEDRASCEATWRAAIAGGTGVEDRFRIRMRDGSYRWHLERAMPQRGPDGVVAGWVGVAVDIDELIASREVIQRYRTELEKLVSERTQALEQTASELQAEMSRREEAMTALSHQHKLDALGQLTAGVAHDFNNLLAAIMGGFQLIESRTEDEGLLTLTRNGLHASERAASLVRQLLSVARREPPRPEWLDLSVALPGMRDLLRHALRPGISLNIEVPRDIWPVFV